MKLTHTKRIKEIVLPPVEGLPAAPAVGIYDSVTQAVELMLKNDRKEIAVVGRCGVIGRIRLEDALKHLGIRMRA